MLSQENSNNNTQLGTLLIRFFAVVMVALGILGLVYAAFLFSVFSTLRPDAFERFLSSFFYLIGGVVIYRYSRNIGRYITRNL